MKNIFFTAFILIVCNQIKGQSTLVSTSEEYDDVINTQNNITKINLFDIDYNGNKVPINLIYSHDGIKVMDKPNSGLGIKWQIENIGKIQQTIKYKPDNLGNGWFYTLNPDFTASSVLTYCNSADSDCSHFGTFNETDLSPDLFSLSISNGINFDFLFKKNILAGIIGIPTPEFLSNPDGYKINTNFNNFTLGCSPPNNNVVFNIIDKFGNNYDFVNGPSLVDSGRSNTCRNDYYLKQIINASNLDFVNIEYISKEIIKEKYYAVGLNTCKFYGCSQSDFDNNIIKYPNHDYYLVDESRFDVKKISTHKVIIDFVYSSNEQYLNEINISDLKGNYILGYKFEYQELQGTSTNTLYQIKKYNSFKQLSQIIYEFEYNDGPDIFSNTNLYIQDGGQYEDYFGYFNFQYKTNLLPFDVRNTDGTLSPAGNFEPNLIYAKVHSLKKIKNKYGGITEFDYQLRNGSNLIWSNLYGGGIVISSKKQTPIIGVPTLITYEYENLRGFVLNKDLLEFHYLKQIDNTKYFSSLPILMNSEETPFNQDLFPSIHNGGNFYGTIIESNFDFNTMQLNSKTITQFVPNYEGINRGSLLESETFKNSSDITLKKNIYHYTTQTIESFPSADYRIDSRAEMGTWKWFNKTEKNISINRTTLSGKTEIQYFGANTITNNSSFSYLNSNSKLLRNKIKVSSLGENIEERYFYPQDIQMTSEPFVTDLIAKNYIGTPLKTETYRNNEKLSEQKIVYIKDATTNNLLLPKFIYSKKGDVVNNTLEKKITFDKYDTNGVLLQYTAESGVPVSIIWGYNKTQIIAKIENVAYATIPASLITAAQTASDTNNETTLLLALSDLRNNSSLASALVTSYTFKPLIGVSTITDAKGDKITYEYDELNRQKGVKDKNGYILSETVYHTNN